MISKKFLKELIEDILLKGKYPNLKILGICFGLEIIVSAFKGEIIKQPWSSEACYDIEKIFINKDFFNLDFVKKSNIEKTNFLYINEAHSESISKLPKFPKLNIFGYSNSCKYEVLVDDNEKIFLIQGHPEYSPGLYLCKDIDYFMEIKKIEYNEENKKQFLNDYLNEEKRKNANFITWRKLCWTFMKEN
jgi:GMP synthase-like glutamine amidotransferase